jgi:hypothetical protein
MMCEAKVTVSIENHTKHKFNVISIQNFWVLNMVLRYVTGRLLKV